MAYDYDKLYGETRDALGPPNKRLVDFFEMLPLAKARVLDVGCGQGRDALFIARRGHSVLGIDISPNGIRDLMATARKEGLPVHGLVADIATFSPGSDYDVILIDRTLHMLPRAVRIAVLATLLDNVAEGGWMLILDEPSNIADFETAIAAHDFEWTTELRTRGVLFVRRD